MNIRHVIDESGLRLDGDVAHGTPSVDTSNIVEFIADIIDRFLDRIDMARQRNEQVMRSGRDIWDSPVNEDLTFYDLIYGDNPSQSAIVDPDRTRRLMIAIDRVAIWDDDPELLKLVGTLEVDVAGKQVFAPSLGLALACRAVPRVVGCLNFQSSGRAGALEVTAEDHVHPLHFVIDEDTHVQMFRDAIVLEDMDERAFESSAPSAFPGIQWVDGVWRGLGKFKRPYLEHREVLIKHLGVLSDEAARLFDELSATHPEQIAGNLGALGVDASDENGRTKRNAEARKDRTREFRGQDHVFWWHTKLRRNIDRIHFKWLRDDDDGRPGEIVVGVFIDHCHVPD